MTKIVLPISAYLNLKNENSIYKSKEHTTKLFRKYDKKFIPPNFSFITGVFDTADSFMNICAREKLIHEKNLKFENLLSDSFQAAKQVS